MILAGKRLLITGVITKDSIAFHAAEQAQREGASVVLTSFGRVRRLTERAAQRLPEPVDVLELDVNSPADLEAVAGELRQQIGIPGFREFGNIRQHRLLELCRDGRGVAGNPVNGSR